MSNPDLQKLIDDAVRKKIIEQSKIYDDKILSFRELIMKNKEEISNLMVSNLTEHKFDITNLLQAQLSLFKNEINQNEKELLSSVEGISIRSVHKVVNGSLNKINDQLVIIHDTLNKTKNKTIYWAFINNINKKPIRTFIILLFCILLLVDAVAKIYKIENLDIMQHLIKLVSLLWK